MAKTGARRRRSGRATRRDVADAGLGARSLPAPAASAHAARHRGDLGPPAALRRTTRTCSSSRRGRRRPMPAWLQRLTRRAPAASTGLIELITAMRAARAEAGIQPADIIDATVWLPDGPARAAFDDLKPVVERLARVRATHHRRASHARADAAWRRWRSSLRTGRRGSSAPMLTGNARTHGSRRSCERRGRTGRNRQTTGGSQLHRPRAGAVVEQAQRRAAELREQIAALRARLRRTARGR